MKTTLSIIIGAALCAAIAIGPSSHVARAGDEYDCNKAEKWVKRTTPTTKARFACTNEPSKNAEWVVVGECKYGTDPH